MFNNLVYYIQNSGNDFLLFFIFLALYGIIKIFLFIPEVLLKRSSPKNILSIVGSIALIFVISFIFFAGVDLALGKINIAGIDNKVAINNNFLMELDNKIFHTYVPFWFENSNNPASNLFRYLSELFVRAYDSLAILIAISLIAVIVKDSNLFLKIMSIYFVIITISLAFWFFLPATTPLDAYVDKILKPVPNVKIERYLATFRPSLPVTEFANSIRTGIRKQMGDKLWVTSIPSMHIAWSVVILYTAMLLSRYLLYAAVPYFIFNMIATMSALQHYAVDVILGVVVGIFAIKLVNRLPPLKIPILDSLSNSLRQDVYGFVRLFK